MCFTIRQEYIVKEGQELSNIYIFIFLLITWLRFFLIIVHTGPGAMLALA